MVLLALKRDLVVGCIVPDFSFVVMNPADQISLASSMTIPQITTPPMAHHGRPPSEFDSIHLDPMTEPLSQQTPPYNQENGELFFSYNMQICHSCVDHRVAFNAHIPVYIPQVQ